MFYQKTSKINWLLILQGWTMLWVVIGHASLQTPHSEMSNWYSDLLTDIAYSFHMPMFIFISGYLFYLTRIKPEKLYLPMIKDKIIKLGIPYLLFTLFAMVLKSIFASEMERPTEISIHEIWHAILYPDDGPVSGFWFLAVIMWCFIFSPVWKYLLRNRVTVICGLVFTLVLCVCVSFSTNNILCFPKFLAYSFYYFLGIVACRYGSCEIKTSVAFFAGVVLLLLFICLFLLRIQGLEVLAAVMGMTCSICLAQILDKFIPGVFSSFRQYTYQIYLMSIFFQIVCKIIFNSHGINNIVAYALCIISGLYFPVLISLVIEKINFTPLYVCIGLTKKK